MNHKTSKSTAVLTGALLITSDIGASAEAGSVTTSGSGKLLAISTNTIRVLHRSVTIDAEFEPFTHALEKILGHFPREFSRTSSNDRDARNSDLKRQRAHRS